MNASFYLVELVHYLSTCILGLAFFYSLAQFYISKNALYVVYGAYVILAISLGLVVFHSQNLISGIDNLEKWQIAYLQTFLQTCIYAIYIVFVTLFLDFKRRSRRLYKGALLYQVLSLVFLVYYFWEAKGNQIASSVFLIKHWIHVLNVPFILLLLAWVVQISSPLKWFVLLGGFILFSSTFIEIAALELGLTKDTRSLEFLLENGFIVFNYVQFGYVLESFVFLSGVSYKNRKLHQSLVEHQTREIEALQKEGILQKELKQVLSEKLDLQKRLNRKEKKKSEVLKSQLRSFQLQMNPHFLFNSLNSVNDYIVSQNPEIASKYLEKYAKLMRGILEASDHFVRTLDEELVYCELYLQLEQLRFKRPFAYNIRVEDNLLLKSQIPSMMLQPVLENAIWHGLMHVPYDGLIDIQILKKKHNFVEVLIWNNGAALKNKNAGLALKNIATRLTLFSEIYGKEILFELKNKENRQGVEAVFLFPKL